jgi:hypothetical protein
VSLRETHASNPEYFHKIRRNCAAISAASWGFGGFQGSVRSSFAGFALACVVIGRVVPGSNFIGKSFVHCQRSFARE